MGQLQAACTMPTVWEVVVATGMGLISGYGGGMIGIAGASFLVALLVFVVGMEQRLAQGTVLCMMLGPMTLPGCVVMWDRIKVLWRPILAGIIGYTACTYLGALVAFAVSPDAVRVMFGVLLILISLNNLLPATVKCCRQLKRSNTIRDPNTPTSWNPYESFVDETSEEVSMGADCDDTDKEVCHDTELNPEGATIMEGALFQFSVPWMACLGACFGFLGGMLGIGAGVLMNAPLNILFKLHKDDARAVSLALLCPPVTIGAVVEYAINDDVQPTIAIALFLSYSISNYFGAKTGRRLSTENYQLVFGVLVMTLGILSIVDAFVDYSRVGDYDGGTV